MDSFLIFLKKLLVSSTFQLFYIFGTLLFLGLVLFLFAKFTRISFVKTLGLKADIFFTGWIGTPIHELGHALFCLIFFHKIEELQLFKPEAKSGTLGYVNHTYNKKNIYQRAGNFFIGIGPLFSGSFVIVLLMFFLFPDSKIFDLIFRTHPAFKPEFGAMFLWIKSVAHFFIDVVFLIFNIHNFKMWQFWIFLYTSMAVASHMELSISDIKGSFFGFFIIILLILIVNSIAIAIGTDVTEYAVWIAAKSGIVTNVLICAVVMSICCFCVVFLLLTIIHLIHKRAFFSPFR